MLVSSNLIELFIVDLSVPIIYKEKLVLIQILYKFHKSCL